MKVKKLIISVVASILLAAALTGCTGTTDNEGSAKSHTNYAVTNAIIASNAIHAIHAIHAHSYSHVHIR